MKKRKFRKHRQEKSPLQMVLFDLNMCSSVMMIRFYEVNGGAIKLDNKDIESMSRHDIRAHFGMVLQDTWLFNGTIRDNIAYGKTDAAETEVIQAAKAAEADQFIRMLPDGYDT